MHTYISILLSSLTSLPSVTPSREIYTTSFSSPLLHLAHLDRLAKCTRNFLTPGQTRDAVLGIFQVLEESWNVFWEAQQRVSSDVGKGSRKKRKTNTEGLPAGARINSPEALVVRFALAARLSCTVLPAFSLQILPESARQEVRQLLADFQLNFIRRVLTQIFEEVWKNRQDQRDDLWASQVAAAALLRLEYILVAARQLELQAASDERESERMLEIVSDSKLLPELGVEIVCIFFYLRHRVA